MSLRRSARVVARPLNDSIPNISLTDTAPKALKRDRKSNDASENTGTHSTAGAGPAPEAKTMLPPPSTPNKRRKVAKAPPPVTPTPSAIGFMMNSTPETTSSTRDIDGVTPTLPAKPHQTNAILVTPGGTQVQQAYSTFEENSSPSKQMASGSLTTKTILQEACAHLLKVDPNLEAVIDQHYCKAFCPEGLAETIDPFRSLVSGIIAQQVSGAAASSIKKKFINLFPSADCPRGFPTPALVAATPISRLREAGLSQRKAEYTQGLAEKFTNGDLTVDMLMNGSDDEVMEKLIAVRGLGAWSVEMFMCFGLKRLDIFSTGDLGVQRGMAAYKGKDVSKLKAKGGGKWKYMSEKEMLETAEVFRPYRSLFMWYMWRIEDVNVDAVQSA